MKTFKLSVAFVAIALLFSIDLAAAKVTSMEIVPVENQKVFLLSVESSGNGNIDMRIKNAEGTVKFLDKQSSLSSFVKKIDLSELTNGVYTFEIEDEFFLSISKFTLSDLGIVVEDQKATKRCKPIFKWDEETRNFDVNWLLNDYGNTRITLRDENANVIQREIIKNKLVVARRYRMLHVKDGSYSMTVKSGGREYTKKIEIN